MNDPLTYYNKRPFRNHYARGGGEIGSIWPIFKSSAKWIAIFKMFHVFFTNH